MIMMEELRQLSVLVLVFSIVHAASGCNGTITLINETVVTNLNESCSWTIQSPKATTIVLQVTGLHLNNLLDGVRVLDGETRLIAYYSDLDQSGDLLVSSNNSLIVITSYTSNKGNFTVSLTPQVGGGRFKESGQVKLNGTSIPQNESSLIYFQLIATKGQQVQILLNDSNLTPTPRIAFYDGLKPLPKNLLVELNTNTQFFPITSRTGAMLVVSKDLDQQEFFSGYFKSVPTGCDIILTSTTMNFHMQRMKSETSCSIVAAPKNKGETSFRIQTLNLCPSESVTIYEGRSHYGKKIATLTTNSSSVTPSIYVRADNGFLIEVNQNNSQCSNETFPTILSGMYSSRPACGKTLKSLQGTITSPEYPNLYPLNADCVWNLPVPENTSTFVYVAMETAALAPGHTLSLQDNTGTALWTFSGAQPPSTDMVVNLTTSDVAQLIFDSSSKLGQDVGQVSTGFKVTYKMLKCGGFLTSSNGSLEIPEWVPWGESCIWVIRLPRGGANNTVTNIVQFSLTHPKVSSNSSIVVLDGGTSKSSVFHFNSKESQKYLSRTNALWVKMVHDVAPSKLKLSYNTYSCGKKDQCHSSGWCIHPEWRCNGVDECGDMSDEQNCSSNPASKSGLKTYLIVIIALMSFAFGVVLTIVIPAVYKRCRYPNYRHLQDLMEPSVT